MKVIFKCGNCGEHHEVQIRGGMRYVKTYCYY